MRAHVVTAANRVAYLDELEAMHRHRHDIFVDLMGWHALESPDRLDIDEFDTANTIYLLLIDDNGLLAGCDRLIPSWHPHMLKNLFPEYVTGSVPVGPTIWEWSRRAPGHPRFSRATNRLARDISEIAVAEFALSRGIETFTGIIELNLVGPAIERGWNIVPLGDPIEYGEGVAIGVRINVDHNLLNRLRTQYRVTGPALIEMPAGLSTNEPHHARRAVELAMRLPDTSLEPAAKALLELIP